MEVMGRGGGDRTSFEIDQRYYPEIPVLRGLATTWDGRIWVQRRGEEPGTDGPIDVRRWRLSLDSPPLNPIRLPASSRSWVDSRQSCR